MRAAHPSLRTALLATILGASAVAPLAAADSARAPLAAAADSPRTSLAADADGSRTSLRAPLIAYALELGPSDSRSDLRELYQSTAALRAVTFEIERSLPPRDEDCAQTLGASRFAEQYAQLATIQDQLGNFEAVVQAHRSALACTPRVASYEASLAAAYINLDQIAAARAAAERANALDPDDPEVRELRARLDFIEEHWADATSRFRLLALGESQRLSQYARVFLWLAQRRAGLRNPDIPEPKPATPVSDEPSRAQSGLEQWPAQMLGALKGELSEDDLVQVIRQTVPESDRRGWLTEALYYIGERRLAEGDAETARRHFATVINLRVLGYVEYGMARAELKKMRDRKALAEATAAGASTPGR